MHAFLVRAYAEKLVPNEDAYCMGRVESNTRLLGTVYWEINCYLRMKKK